MGRAACHPSKAMAAFLATQRDGLVVERLPGYAPTSTPSRQVWSSLKRNELTNVGAEGLGEVIAAAWHGIERIRAAWHLPYSFLRHTGLLVLLRGRPKSVASQVPELRQRKIGITPFDCPCDNCAA